MIAPRSDYGERTLRFSADPDVQVIETASANELMTEIHNSGRRMPLIIPEERRPAWLDTGLARAPLQAMMQPLPDGLLVAEPARGEPEQELLLF